MEKKIKEMQTLIKIQHQFIVHNTIYADYTDNTTTLGDSLVKIKDVIIPPRKFFVTTDNYTIANTVQLKNVEFDSINIPNRITIHIAEKKDDWFKRRQQIVQIMNSNPYIETESIQSITLKPTISAWNR